MEHGDKYDISRLTNLELKTLANLAIQLARASGPHEVAAMMYCIATAVKRLSKTNRIRE